MAKKNSGDLGEPLGSPRTFRIGRRRYVVGLFWQVAENSKTVTREARSLARERGIDADLYLKRSLPSTGEAQFALARSREGVQRGSVAAAAALADQVPQQAWAAVFPLTDGYWYVRVRNGMIMPDGDTFYEEEADARARFDADAADGGFELLFSPEDWSSTSDQLDYESLLARSKQPVITDLNPAKANRGAVLLGLLVVIAGGAGWYGYQYQQELAAEKEQQELLKAEAANALKKAQKQDVPPPWHDLPPPSSVISACASGMSALLTNAPGFQLRQIICDGRSSTFYWDRVDRSNIRWIERWIERQGDYPVQIVGGGEAVTVRVPVEPGAKRGKEPVYPAQVVRNGLISLGQATDTRVVVGDVQQWEPPRGFDPEKFKTPKFAHMPLEIQVSSLTEWVEILDRIPGLIVHNVVWDHAQKTYEITGVIYVKN